jgi:hypothetical protein
MSEIGAGLTEDGEVANVQGQIEVGPARTAQGRSQKHRGWNPIVGLGIGFVTKSVSMGEIIIAKIGIIGRVRRLRRNRSRTLK